jgi:alpha-L-rhamnosidase
MVMSSPARWTAAWIEPDQGPAVREVQRPVHHLAATFPTTSVVSATLHATAHGLYEAFVNGERVGDAELTPGFTAYRRRLQVQSYDVTTMVRRGDNAWGFLLSDGWWRGQNHLFRFVDVFGDDVAVLAELHVTDEDGQTTVHTTDGGWRSTPSHILGADLIAGEVHDLRRRVRDWCSPGVDRSTWSTVRVVDHGVDQLCETVGPPVRRMRELDAVSVTEVRPGRHVVDFGQVSNGWVRVGDLGPEGTDVTIVHGEALLPDGTDVDIAGNDAVRKGVPFQTDVVTSAGDGSTFEPRHSTKGFRYVRIDGHPGPLSPGSLTSVVVHNDVRPVGGFWCSDDDLNRLHLAADWSLRTNLCSVPTDCPTRERAGYTGDWQIFVGTAAYLYDVTDLSVKWLHDVAADQLESGAVTSFSPDPGGSASSRVPWWPRAQGSAGWGDAIVHVPWELYRATGRTDVLSPFIGAMRRWVDFGAHRAATRRHPDRAAERPAAAPHEQFLWDTGFHLGEWLEPDGPGFDVALLGAMDHGATATGFLHRSADELSRIAAVVGDEALASRYGVLAKQARDAWRAEFLDPEGAVTKPSQATLVRALAFGLVPDAHRERVTTQLVDLVRAADTHLGTGFLATPFLLPVLADNSHLDLAYELLFQRTPPSWLAMLDAGATTVWESWRPHNPDGTLHASLNHFSMGAVISFLHRYVAGLQLVEPGYRRFKVEPRIGGGVTSASTHHDAPYGRIAVRRSVEAGRGRISVTVPPETQADLVLPDGDRETLPAGTHDRAWLAS